LSLHLFLLTFLGIDMEINIYQGDCLKIMKDMPSSFINCCVTSPPYWGLRDYGVDDQLGLETNHQDYVNKMVEVFREVRRILRDDGTLWLNLGDSYSGSGKGAYKDGVVRLSEKSKKQKTNSGTHHGVFVKTESGLKPKDLVGIPWRVAFALQEDGWYLRQDIIWSKPNPMPESVQDRCTKSHEYIFLLSKSPKYYFSPIKEKAVGPAKKCGIKNDASRNDSNRTGILRGDGVTRNKRSVWTVSTKPFKEAHFATFPPDLIEPCILAGCPKNGIILDPFFGSGTTGLVAQRHERNCIGIELNPNYIEIAKNRLGSTLHETVLT
jgi:DNA modification methylase